MLPQSAISWDNVSIGSYLPQKIGERDVQVLTVHSAYFGVHGVTSNVRRRHYSVPWVVLKHSVTTLVASLHQQHLVSFNFSDGFFSCFLDSSDVKSGCLLIVCCFYIVHMFFWAPPFFSATQIIESIYRFLIGDFMIQPLQDQSPWKDLPRMSIYKALQIDHADRCVPLIPGLWCKTQKLLNVKGTQWKIKVKLCFPIEKLKVWK